MAEEVVNFCSFEAVHKLEITANTFIVVELSLG